MFTVTVAHVTINMLIGTIAGVIKKGDMYENVQPSVKKAEI